MKKILLMILVLLPFGVMAQMQTQAGIFVSGDANFYSRAVSPNPEHCNCTGDHLNDSLSKQDRRRYGFTAGFSYNKKIGRDWMLQTGFWYNDKGFERYVENLQFGDQIHPEIGTIYDASSTGNPKNVRFIYKFQYLQIPLLFNYMFNRSRHDKKWDYYFSVGASGDFLIKHNFKALLEGFSVNGENKFNVTETGMHPAKVNATLMMGARFEYRWDKNTELCIQPLIRVPVLNVNNDDARYRLFNPGISVGLNWKIQASQEGDDKRR